MYYNHQNEINLELDRYLIMSTNMKSTDMKLTNTKSINTTQTLLTNDYLQTIKSSKYVIHIIFIHSYYTQ